MQSLSAFFTTLWSPNTTQAEQLGYPAVIVGADSH